jgi:sugar phosphate isomerase/epimerase
MISRLQTATTVLVCVGIACWATRACDGQSAAAQPQREAHATRPFFAFCFDTHDAEKRDYQQQAAMLKELGFDGAGHVGLDGLAERLASLDRAGLPLCLAGMVVDVSQPADQPLGQLKAVLPLLKGRDTLLYVNLKGYPPADPRGEEPGIRTLRALADLAAPAGVRLAIYPHTSDWVAQFAYAVTIANKVDRDNCGVIFNLCHFLRNEDAATMAAVLRSAQGRLMAVTLNGADVAGKSDNDWQRLIQPLDQGTFDVASLLQQLKQLNYRGPIGLMCYGITGDAQQHLARSIARWREIRGALE